MSSFSALFFFFVLLASQNFDMLIFLPSIQEKTGAYPRVSWAVPSSMYHPVYRCVRDMFSPEQLHMVTGTCNRTATTVVASVKQWCHAMRAHGGSVPAIETVYVVGHGIGCQYASDVLSHVRTLPTSRIVVVHINPITRIPPSLYTCLPEYCSVLYPGSPPLSDRYKLAITGRPAHTVSSPVLLRDTHVRVYAIRSEYDVLSTDAVDVQQTFVIPDSKYHECFRIPAHMRQLAAAISYIVSGSRGVHPTGMDQEYIQTTRLPAR